MTLPFEQVGCTDFIVCTYKRERLMHCNTNIETRKQ